MPEFRVNPHDRLHLIDKCDQCRALVDWPRQYISCPHPSRTELGLVATEKRIYEGDLWSDEELDGWRQRMRTWLESSPAQVAADCHTGRAFDF